MIGIGRGSGSRLKLPDDALPAAGRRAARPSGPRRTLTLFVFAPGRDTPRRVPLPGWLVAGALLVLGLVGAAGVQVWQQNQALEAELIALRQTQALGDTRESELHTVVGLQDAKLAGQATQLQTQNQQLTTIQQDLDD